MIEEAAGETSGALSMASVCPVVAGGAERESTGWGGKRRDNVKSQYMYIYSNLCMYVCVYIFARTHEIRRPLYKDTPNIRTLLK